ncbi:hypothetical protein ALC56_09483 [Trachymyrmex septentrionalis]|uniref:Uncharacterized protein n=1 Tax=Trachymyrmex septentrionalis TaxID=34720 RepID=A0A151JUQ3_9HYME|nr:hypothetical protein ALC56_09483 [Trachymyrmex septentrionalis]
MVNPSKHHKPFFDRYLNYISRHPLCQKNRIILIDRVLSLSYPIYHQENFELLIKILLNNGYPLKLIFSEIKNRLSKKFKQWNDQGNKSTEKSTDNNKELSSIDVAGEFVMIYSSLLHELFQNKDDPEHHMGESSLENLGCSLSRINCFPFENTLSKIKQTLQTSVKPLVQVCRKKQLDHTFNPFTNTTFGSAFEACNLSNGKLYLNSDFHLYDDFNLDFDKKRYAILFDMYARFRKAYYEIDCFETLFNVLSFVEKGPFAIINYSSRQNIKSATVDVRIKFNCKKNMPANTTVYCLIIHEINDSSKSIAISKNRSPCQRLWIC